jgi:hypothetical protein
MGPVIRSSHYSGSKVELADFRLVPRPGPRKCACEEVVRELKAGTPLACGSQLEQLQTVPVT